MAGDTFRTDSVLLHRSCKIEDCIDVSFYPAYTCLRIRAHMQSRRPLLSDGTYFHIPTRGYGTLSTHSDADAYAGTLSTHSDADAYAGTLTTK